MGNSTQNPPNPKHEVKPIDYPKKKGKKPSKNFKGQCIHMAKHQRYLDKPHPDPQTPYITGCYEAEDQTFTFNINQAGSHIECWHVEVLTAKEGKREKLVYRLGGERQDDGTFHLFVIYEDGTISDKIGTLKQQGNNLLADYKFNSNMGYIIGSQQLIRRRITPIISENALRSFRGDIRANVGSYEWSPLVSSRVIWLKNALFSGEMLSHLKAYFDVGGGSQTGDWAWRNAKANDFDHYIGWVFSTAPPNGWHPQDLNTARISARQLLAVTRWTYHNTERSLLDWIHVMLVGVQYDFQRQLPNSTTKMMENVRTNLGLSAEDLTTGKLTEHQYHFTLEVVHYSADYKYVNLGGFIGVLLAEKKTPPTWTATYKILLGGTSLGISKGVQVGFITEGDAFTPSNWLPGELPGWCNMINLGATISKGIGFSVSGTMMYINGSGSHPGMTVDFSGLSYYVGDGMGAEIAVSLGYIFEPIEDLNQYKFSDQVIQNFTYSAETGAEKSIHFLLDSAILTDVGREALRIFCAVELTALMSPGSSLVITGHADRLDTKIRNIELSKNRAENTLQAIRDILGDKFMIPKEQYDTVGMGELKAEVVDHEKDNTPDPKWRKVDIVLNSRLVLSLYGQ